MLAEALIEQVLGDAADVQILDRFPGAAIDGVRYEPPFGYIGAEVYGERGHTVLLADFVTADDGTGLVHTAIAFGEDDFRLGEQYGLNVVNPVRPTGPTTSASVATTAASSRTPTPTSSRTSRRAGACCAPSTTSTPTRTAGAARRRCCTTPSRPGTSPPRRSATGCWRPTSRSTGTPSTSSTGASGAGWRTTSTGRCRASATGARRCRCGAARTITSASSGPSTSSSSAPARASTTRTVPSATTSPSPAPSAARRRRACPRSSTSGSTRARCRSPSGTSRSRTSDASSGSTRPTSSARRWTRRAAGSTRCSASRRCCSTRVPYRDVVCLGLILDDDGQKMSKSKGNVVGPWEVLDRFGADALRWYFFTSKQPWDGYLFSLEAIGEGVRLFLTSCGTPTGSRRCTRTASAVARATRSRRADRPRPLDPLAAERDRRGRHRAPGRLRRDDRRPRDRRLRRRPLQLVHAPLAAALLGGRRGGVRRRCASCLVTVSQLLAPFTPFIADEIYDNLDGDRAQRPPDRLAGAGRARRGARVRDGDRPRDRAPWPRRARRREDQGLRQPLHEVVIVAAGRERESIERLGEHRPRGAQRQAAALRRRGRRAGLLRRSSPTTAALGPRFGKAMPQVAAADRGARPRPRRRLAARGPHVGVIIDGHDHSSAADDLLVGARAARGLPARARGRHAVALELADRRGAAPRRLGPRDRPRRPERPQRRGARRLGPHQRSRSAATRRCWKPRDTTRRTWPARCSPSAWRTPPTAPASAPASRAASCGSRWPARVDGRDSDGCSAGRGMAIRPTQTHDPRP